MLLQTNSYIVPRDKRAEHARLLRRFRQTLLRLGCDHFEVYEQVGANWNTGDTTGRFVQIMRFRDRKHQLAVQTAERTDPTAQQLVNEFCELINFPYQQQQGLFAVGFYTSFLKMPAQRTTTARAADDTGEEAEIIDGADDLTAHLVGDAVAVSAEPGVEPGVAGGAAGNGEEADEAAAERMTPEELARAQQFLQATSGGEEVAEREPAAEPDDADQHTKEASR